MYFIFRSCLILVALLYGCESVTDLSLKERLVGSWVQRISILGEKEESILTFHADGTFTQTGSTTNQFGTVPHAPLRGTWLLTGKKIEFTYEMGDAGNGTPKTNQRAIVALTDHDFVSVDTRFGIEVHRQRLSPSTR